MQRLHQWRRSHSLYQLLVHQVQYLVEELVLQKQKELGVGLPVALATGFFAAGFLATGFLATGFLAAGLVAPSARSPKISEPIKPLVIVMKRRRDGRLLDRSFGFS